MLRIWMEKKNKTIRISIKRTNRWKIEIGTAQQRTWQHDNHKFKLQFFNIIQYISISWTSHTKNYSLKQKKNRKKENKKCSSTFTTHSGRSTSHNPGGSVVYSSEKNSLFLWVIRISTENVVTISDNWISTLHQYL